MRVRLAWCVSALTLLIVLNPCRLAGQVIEFESNGLKYQALTRNGFTVMMALLPEQVREYTVMQVAVSNGSTVPQTIRPEDFLFLRDDGAELSASAPRSVVDSLISRASRADVVKLITAYENSIYGNTRYQGTNGYEQRRQSALTAFTSTRLRAAAAASAIAFVQTRLAPGQSTDGAIFYPTYGKPLGNGRIRIRLPAGSYDFPLISSNHSP